MSASYVPGTVLSTLQTLLHGIFQKRCRNYAHFTDKEAGIKSLGGVNRQPHVQVAYISLTTISDAVDQGLCIRLQETLSTGRFPSPQLLVLVSGEPPSLTLVLFALSSPFTLYPQTPFPSSFSATHSHDHTRNFTITRNIQVLEIHIFLCYSFNLPGQVSP